MRNSDSCVTIGNMICRRVRSALAQVVRYRISVKRESGGVVSNFLHLSFFDVAGCVLVLALALMWLLVGTRTVQGAYRGELFVSPCIAGLKK